MPFDVAYVWSALLAGLKYLDVSLILALSSYVIGLALGTWVAVIGEFKTKVLARVLQVLVVIGKGIPIVLMIYLVNYGVLKPIDALADLTNHPEWKLVDKFWLLLIAFAIFATVNIAEMMRGALASVSNGQYEAAYAMGMGRWRTMRRIVLPQAYRAAIPMLCNNLIGQLKYTSLAFLLGITDVMNAAQLSAQRSYRYLEAYVAVALIYWAVCALIEYGSKRLERRLRVAAAAN